MKILVVDDNPDAAELLKLVLQPYGDVDTATEGLQALDKIRQAWEQGQPFELILLDVLMPKMDGLEALSVLRREERSRGIADAQRTKVIMITAYADEENMQRALSIGCEGYVFKTAGKNKILDRLRVLGLIE